MNGEEQHCDSISGGLRDANGSVFRASKPDVIESCDENSSNGEIPSLYPIDLHDRVQDSDIPPLIHAKDISDEVDKAKSNKIENVIHVYKQFLMLYVAPSAKMMNLSLLGSAYICNWVWFSDLHNSNMCKGIERNFKWMKQAIGYYILKVTALLG